MTVVYNGSLRFMPSIVCNCVLSCDWSQPSHGTDRANHSPSVPCDELWPITTNDTE
ncbi:unnamed protein product [Staurois parvus]|uniref:Uncharacterized protein n=1 Tax=Staurois parvus TaxID=386267 RepID=A0ABN9HL01_9NEOB|nr:unnamed protein product [Staurois parvus]